MNFYSGAKTQFEKGTRTEMCPSLFVWFCSTFCPIPCPIVLSILSDLLSDFKSDFFSPIFFSFFMSDLLSDLLVPFLVRFFVLFLVRIPVRFFYLIFCDLLSVSCRTFCLGLRPLVWSTNKGPPLDPPLNFSGIMTLNGTWFTLFPNHNH